MPFQIGLPSPGSAGNDAARKSDRNRRLEAQTRRCERCGMEIQAEDTAMDKRDDGKPPRKARATTRCLRVGPYLRFPDEKLVEMILAGETEAYDELVERHQNAVKSLAYSVVGDYQRAEDLAQDAFIKAYSELGDLQDRSKFSRWVLTIVRHTALDYLRARKEGVSLEILREHGWEAEKYVEDDALQKAENNEENLRVLEVLGEMREDYREIILLKHLEHRSYKEIARLLNMSVSAVGEKLSRVRGVLKKRLEKKPIPGRRPSERGRPASSKRTRDK